MMDVARLNAYITAHHTRSAFRLETLQQYEVASDGNDFGRYLAGADAPTAERKGPWLDQLRDEKDRGLYRHRVRIVTAPVTDYTRYECEWGYLPNAEAGEDVRILDLADRALPPGSGLDQDFWFITDEHGHDHAVAMHYSATGEYLGATVEPDLVPGYRNARDALWSASEPFSTWWARHPELHRGNRKEK